MRMKYTLFESRLGPALIAATDVGVCALLFSECEEFDLAGDLGRRFPDAGLVEVPSTDFAVRSAVKTVSANVHAAERLPLHLLGTPFQCSVWKELRRIPTGKTVSYSELAGRIGKPSSARAVASACGANHIAVAVPCHRVVASDGSLGGYRWGTEKKRLLLALERQDGSAE